MTHRHTSVADTSAGGGSHRRTLDLGRYERALDILTERQDEMVATVQDWSAVNSGTGNLDGLAAMDRRVVDAFGRLNADLTPIELPDGQAVGADGALQPVRHGRMLRFSKRPDAPRRVLLTGHTDTVFPADHPFQTTRWLDDTTLNGPGVADMKGGIIVMLHALDALERSGLAAGLGWEVLLSPDEETGSLGSGPVLAERARTAHIGMTYEPALSDGTLAGARKGSGNFTVVVRGRAAHAGREFDHGRNAVAALARFIAGLDALNGQRPGVTFNAARITGGTAPNIVPDLALCRFNIRVGTAEDQRWAADQIAALVAEADGGDGLTAELHGQFNRPPKPLTPANQALFEAVEMCGRALDIPVAFKATGGCCEGNNLAAAGLPNVDTLGVRGGAIHSADEFVLVDSFVERARLSTLMLMALADGALDDLLALRANGMAGS